MKRTITWIVILILILAGAYWGYRHYNREKPFVLSGTIESRDIEVGSLIGGRVISVLVKEGDQVVAKQPLVLLETDLLDLQISEQQAVIAQSKANLARIRKGPRSEETNRAKFDWQNAEGERKRMEDLYHQGIIGRQDYDNAVTKAATAEEAYKELERGNRQEDIDAAEAALKRDQDRLAYLNRQRQESIVVSPADGTIQSLDLRPGDLVAANQAVAKILEPSQLWVRVYVPEPDLGKVRLGQKAFLMIDTYPNRQFSGQVVEISSQGEYTPRNVQTLDQRYDQVFGVKINIDPTSELKPGMAAIVHMVT
ncbi:MAG TPA: HlyD family efflux transporter periplasmic adaptor subunit, partial [Acidobacteriota bacterium]|nr:HlyD family efflux transporter periplasmic adaptor subunit [Acidobacteriota bacterium]